MMSILKWRDRVNIVICIVNPLIINLVGFLKDH